MQKSCSMLLAVCLFFAACTSADLDAGTDDPANDRSEEAAAGVQDEPASVTSEATPVDDPPVLAPPADIDPNTLPQGELLDFGEPPTIPEGPLDAATAEAAETLMGDRLTRRIFDERSTEAIDALGASGDPRVAWWLTDLLRIARDPDLSGRLTDASEQLLGIQVDAFGGWGEITDHLMAWDVPAPPDYLSYKRNAFLLVEPKWETLLVDDAAIDWRFVSWGGVLIDDRPFDQTDDRCNCIPAADNPNVTDVAGGDAWLADDSVVFGVTINGESRAYPRSIMEVREMVNDTLGGRDFAMPYCTLCGSAQVWFTDDVPDGVDRPVLRTSGLLIRSNKVMYDLTSQSIFDTFKGTAVSGSLLDVGVELDQNSVVTTTWGRWKEAHPETTVLDIELALGRPDNDLRNTRDADGPIFPIGDIDPRLPVQEDVLGTFTASGEPIAFHVATAVAALERGESVEVDGVSIVLDGGGVRAIDSDGADLGGHQAFWFAWSQFHPDTRLWPS